MANPYREPDEPPRCEGRWRTLDGRWVYCRFDAGHTGTCWDAYSLGPPCNAYRECPECTARASLIGPFVPCERHRAA